MSEFTEADKAKVLSVLTKITEEDKDKYHVYHDIYHVLKDSKNDEDDRRKKKAMDRQGSSEHKPNHGSLPQPRLVYKQECKEQRQRRNTEGDTKVTDALVVGYHVKGMLLN